MKQTVHVCTPPDPPDPQKAAQVARISPIGQCLEKALKELVYQDSSDNDSNDDDTVSLESSSMKNKRNNGASNEKKSSSSKRIKFNQELSQTILTSFEKAVVQYPWNPPPSSKQDDSCIHTKSSQGTEPTRTIEQNTVTESRNNSSSTNKSPLLPCSSEPPAALLEGKVQYYNRFGGQWRIVISNAILRPRVNLDSKRRKLPLRERPTLWEEEKRNESNQLVRNQIVFDGNVQLLAFDDD